MVKRCATMPWNAEYSLCGDAFDAPQTEDDVEPFELVKPGETVTCEKCRMTIRKIRSEYPRGFKCVS